MKRKITKERKVRGFIIPSDWDENYTVIGVSLQTRDEEEYFVEKDLNGEKLLAFIHKEVEVVGKAREESGNRFICVKAYRLMETNN